VFTRTKHGADKVVRSLAKAGLSAAAIHGNKSQGQRERVLAAFRTGAVRTLIATDIAARGIDVEGISHVVNYDLPNIPESYVHRIGRTARAGADGIAISFCDGEERPFLRDIEKVIRMSIPATDRRGQPRPQANAANGAAPGDRVVQHREHHHVHNGQAPDRWAQTHADNHPGRRDGKPHRGGKPRHQRGHGQKSRNGHPQKSRNSGRQQPRSAGGSDGTIASVGFLQHKPRHGRHPGGSGPAPR